MQRLSQWLCRDPINLNESKFDSISVASNLFVASAMFAHVPEDAIQECERHACAISMSRPAFVSGTAWTWS